MNWTSETFDLIKQIEEISGPNRPENSELSDTESLRKVVHRYHETYPSCAFLQFVLRKMQLSFSGFNLLSILEICFKY